jgi:hypothetical protein
VIAAAADTSAMVAVSAVSPSPGAAAAGIAPTAPRGSRPIERSSRTVFVGNADLPHLGAFPVLAGARRVREAVTTPDGALWSGSAAVALLAVICVALAGLATTRVAEHK